MFTSNFSKSANDPNAVAIALYLPRWYHGKSYPQLAPTKELLDSYHSNHDVEEYKRIYKSLILNNLDPFKVVKELGLMAVLCCYESPTDFCHRFLVAEWLKETMELYIPETPCRYDIETQSYRKRS